MTPMNRPLLYHHATRIADAYRVAVQHETKAERLHTCAGQDHHRALAVEYYKLMEHALADLIRAAGEP